MLVLPPALQPARLRCSTPICACRTKSPVAVPVRGQGGAGGEHGQLLRFTGQYIRAGRAVQPLQGQGAVVLGSPSNDFTGKEQQQEIAVCENDLWNEVPPCLPKTAVLRPDVALYKRTGSSSRARRPVELPQIPAGPRLVGWWTTIPARPPPTAKSLVRAIERQLAVAPAEQQPSLLFFKKNARSALELLPKGPTLSPAKSAVRVLSRFNVAETFRCPRVPTALLEPSPPSLSYSFRDASRPLVIRKSARPAMKDRHHRLRHLSGLSVAHQLPQPGASRLFESSGWLWRLHPYGGCDPAHAAGRAVTTGWTPAFWSSTRAPIPT